MQPLEDKVAVVNIRPKIIVESFIESPTFDLSFFSLSALYISA
ncbi:MAG: hypothetical protein ACFFBD_10695 [Candidatus Hodarchaeota archaeon]